MFPLLAALLGPEQPPDVHEQAAAALKQVILVDHLGMAAWGDPRAEAATARSLIALLGAGNRLSVRGEALGALRALLDRNGEDRDPGSLMSECRGAVEALESLREDTEAPPGVQRQAEEVLLLSAGRDTRSNCTLPCLHQVVSTTWSHETARGSNILS